MDPLPPPPPASPPSWLKPVPGLAALQAAALAAPVPDPAVQRVNQLDAAVLDSELTELLRLQLARACSMFSQGFTERYKPELDALLRLLLWRFTVLAGVPTPGMRLQNLRYRDEHTAAALPSLAANPLHVPGLVQPRLSQRLAWGLLCVLLPWAAARARRAALSRGWSDAPPRSARGAAWTVLRTAERAARAAALANALAFLARARFPTLADRALGLRLVPGSAEGSAAPRPINYAFLSRRLLWEHGASLAAAAAPVVRAAGLPARAAVLRRRLARTPFGSFISGYSYGPGGEGEGGQGGGCAECGVVCARQPHAADCCGRTFCYYCVRVACQDEAEYACPGCGARFGRAAPWLAAAGGDGASGSAG